MAVAEDKKRRRRTKRTGTTKKVQHRSRYTPPTPPSYQRTPRIVPILMFGFFALGVILILLNYFPGAPLIPGDTSNRNLLIGLLFICFGFAASTRYR